MKTIEQKLEQRREWQKAARERAIARQREKLADPAWRESQYQKMRDSIDRRIANALGTLPCIACYMHGVISEEVSLHHISGRTAPGCHKKQLPLCRWHHQHAAPAEVREKYPWL
ncbi:recombinase, partial [Escherichia coli]|nr:recombinase [Escherichia coli]